MEEKQLLQGTAKGRILRFYNLHSTLTVCDPTTFWESSALSAWQTVMKVRLWESMFSVMLELVTQPPSALRVVLKVLLVSGRPFMDQLMRAAGFEGAVTQLSCTASPTLACVAPVKKTSLGASAWTKSELEKREEGPKRGELTEHC